MKIIALFCNGPKMVPHYRYPRCFRPLGRKDTSKFRNLSRGGRRESRWRNGEEKKIFFIRFTKAYKVCRYLF